VGEEVGEKVGLIVDGLDSQRRLISAKKAGGRGEKRGGGEQEGRRGRGRNLREPVRREA